MEVVDLPTRNVAATRLLNVETIQRRRGGEKEITIRHAELSPDGKKVLYLLGDDWSAETNNYTVWFGDQRPTLEAPLDPTLYLWDLDSDQVTRLVGHTSDIASAHFSANSRQIVTAAADGMVKLWDVRGGSSAVDILPHPGEGIALAKFSPDGKWIATAKGELTSWQGERETRRRWFREPDRKTVRLWDATSTRLMAELRGLESLKDEGWRGRLLGDVKSIEFSPDSQRLLTLASDNPGRMKQPDGKEIPAPYNPVRVWDLATGKESLTFGPFKQRPYRAAFSPSGEEILTSGSGADAAMAVTDTGGTVTIGSAPKAVERLRIWDRDGKAGERFGPEKVVADAIWSRDGKRVYLLTQGGGQIWDPRAGTKTGDLEGPAMPRAALSPNGRLLVGYYPAFDAKRLFATLWDAQTRKKIVELTGHTQEITTVAFAPGSTRILTGSADGSVRIWDSEGLLLRQILAHPLPVRAVSVSADGQWFATGSDDAAARIWRLDSGEEWLTLSGHQGPVYAVEFSPDGEKLLTASRDGTARLWPTDPLAAARKRRSRELTEDERKRFAVGVGSND